MIYIYKIWGLLTIKLIMALLELDMKWTLFPIRRLRDADFYKEKNDWHFYALENYEKKWFLVVSWFDLAKKVPRIDVSLLGEYHKDLIVESTKFLN